MVERLRGMEGAAGSSGGESVNVGEVERGTDSKERLLCSLTLTNLGEVLVKWWSICVREKRKQN